MSLFGVPRAGSRPSAPRPKIASRSAFDREGFTRDYLSRKLRGESIAEMARAMGLTENAVSLRAHRLGLNVDADTLRRRTFRSCMCCAQNFLSEGKHNRLCGHCSKQGDVSEYSVSS